jgi:hypothetical protein
MLTIHCTDFKEKGKNELLNIIPFTVRKKVNGFKYQEVEDLACFQFYGDFEESDFYTTVKAVTKNKIPDAGGGPDVSLEDDYLEICIPLLKLRSWLS